MNTYFSLVLVLAVIGSSVALTSEFIPKSFYVIDSTGQKSPTIYLREKRSLEEPLFPLVRMRRSGASSGSGSFSSASASSFANAGSGSTGYNDAGQFQDNLAADFDTAARLAGFPNGFPGNNYGYSGSSGYGGSGTGGGNCCGGNQGGQIPNFHSRFGDDGVEYSGSAQGAKGVYSSSSSAIDSQGNVKYSVKSGKF